MLSSACKKDIQEPQGNVTLSAVMDESLSTKTSLENGIDIRWSASDKISLLSNDKVFESAGTTIKEAGRIAEFTVSASELSKSTFALYPCDQNARIETEGKILSSLSSKQSAMENGFANGVNPALAEIKSNSTSLRFHNAAALVQVSIGNEGIRKLRLSTADGQPLSGPCLLWIDSDKACCIPADDSAGCAWVELEGYFKKGENYNFLIFPGSYKGFKLSVTNKLGQTLSLDFPESISLESNERYVLEALPDLSERFDEMEITLWDRFAQGLEGNLLPDFSFAGYAHGEQAPADISTLGYTVYNICDYGAVPDDGKSDREAFISCLNDIFGEPVIDSNGDLVFPHKEKANAIIHFPEGEFILHAKGDSYESKTIYIRAGSLILSGAGRDKTIITMAQSNQPRSAALYSSPVMIDFKHMSGPVQLTEVTKNAAKGSFSVVVASTAGLNEGDWICLSLNEKSSQAIEEELSPYSLDSRWTELAEQGVCVTDYHQISGIKGNTISFYEPLMHEIKAEYNWNICSYPHYSEVGIEDLCIKGNAKPDYVHHASWEDDGGFKPVNMTRIVNGWIRRVNFESVSEAASLIYCSNASVYDIKISGNRGHSAIRSQESSRVFIGKVKDESGDGIGQDHAVGVSKPAIGTVLWRNSWGSGSCFEAHASQPRATLLDCCSGGWNQMHCGGDRAMLPNHLDDLIIWNFEALNSFSGIWDWWDLGDQSWKFLPPVIVGFHGGECIFNAESLKYEEFHGIALSDPEHAPESLYEAQLEKRLGVLPAWIMDLK